MTEDELEAFIAACGEAKEPPCPPVAVISAPGPVTLRLPFTLPRSSTSNPPVTDPLEAALLSNLACSISALFTGIAVAAFCSSVNLLPLGVVNC